MTNTQNTQTPVRDAQYRLGNGKTIYTVISVNENMALLSWVKPGDIGPRERYLAAAEYDRLVPVEQDKPAASGAYLEPHFYDSFPAPVPFWIVRCDHPSHGHIALNSGHHYREHVKHHAEALAAQHDAEEHPEPCAHPSELRRGSTIYPDGNPSHPVTAWWCHGCGEELALIREYDPEMAERAAIQADDENDRDGYRD